jgi:murein DD-endopeptidase MepM/ murein hydrolase activator NlpD
MPEGTPVVAAREGVVIEAEGDYIDGGKDPSLAKKANAIRILHSDGTIGTYAHFRHKGIAVENGQHVRAGEIIGYAGSTGYSNGPHLHFAVTHLNYRDAALETLSEPITFYVGTPPVPFAASYGMQVTANYSPSQRPAGFLAQWWWALALVAAGLSLLALLRKLR